MPDAAAPAPAASPVAARVREGVPQGSLRHLAVLFSGSDERPLLEAIYAFEAELRGVVRGRSHEAAHARLLWWRAELDRLAGGRPSHPLGQALLPLRGRRDVDLALLHEMLVAADLDMARTTYLTWQELDAYLFRSAGAVQTLIAAALAGAHGLSVEQRDFARRLGTLVRQAELLTELDRDLTDGRLYAPLRALEAAGIDPHAFARERSGAVAHAFIAEWRNRVRRDLATLPALLREAATRATQRHGLVLAALYERRLAHLADAPAASPRASQPGWFAALWTAWRTALRHS